MASEQSVGLILTKYYLVYDEINDFCYKHKFVFVPVYDCYCEKFRVYLFSLKEALKVCEFIQTRNHEAILLNLIFNSFD